MGLEVCGGSFFDNIVRYVEERIKDRESSETNENGRDSTN
jgi:hypothetical protein